ncbi:hemocyte protein-glutamine gamma-glutamyltransferase-like [Pecten maximus]|uniref:hemocyte protein-glutamine gamma-glutamyltransferase-like n=1 Tax=Pecten maximus TaxID=6579 RepID=UPI0014581FBD|nr:hemocyte protein-glutamine gamma-glutamyltransferase-like [Pecten maximus]
MYTKLYRGGVWDNCAPKGQNTKKTVKKDMRMVPSKSKLYGCKTKEPRNERDKKIQPEKVKEKIKEKEEKRNFGLETAANVISAMFGLLEDATEDEIKGDLHIESIDFKIPTNTKKHHTNRYKSTTRKEKPDLVLRRGYSFQMCLTLDREYSKADHDINFIFSIGERKTNCTWMKVPMDENIQDEDSKDRKNWHAQLVSVEKKTILVEITIAPNTIIGEWIMSVESFTKHKEDVVSLIYSSDQDILILLNPWCPADPCYFPTTKQLDEYVLNNKGAVFQGNWHKPHAKPWLFGQFEDGILDICITILNKAFDYCIGPQLADPVMISRAISAIVNNCDDYGVLVGRWDGQYGDGKSPTTWNGSANILRCFANNYQPVMYGQCWVFSAITVTVCRALGLPCRSVTNFASAHDTNSSLTIDNVYVQDPEKEPGFLKPSEEHSADSCWNFHVWNEVWMDRHDLPKGYDGWQVIDATPQEASGGKFACGPAPVAAIKKGDCIMKYDARFIFAEVNADCVDWVIDDGIWKVLNVKKNKVGKCISTRDPDSEDPRARLDITRTYKHEEGSESERKAVTLAMSASLANIVTQEEENDIDIDIKDIDDVIMGTDVEVRLKVKNIAKSKETRTVTGFRADVYRMKYNGITDPNKGFIIREDFKSFALKAGEERVLPMVIKSDDYVKKLLCIEQAGMEIKAYAYIEETKRCIIEKEDFRVRRPDVDVQLTPEHVELNGEIEIKMSLKNPLDVPLTHCSYAICSEAMQLEDEETKVEDVPPNGEWCITVKKKAREYPFFGTEIALVGFDCQEIPNINGMSNKIYVD